LEIQALLITFREALEALLIIGVITTYLRQVKRPEFTKWVWLGAGLAVVASAGVALLFQVVLTGFASMGSEIYLKIGIMLISTVLLTQMVFWMAKQSKDMKDKSVSKMDQFVTAGNVAGMVLHSFLVVLREGVETVFFFAAITGGNIGNAMKGWGAMTGILLAFALSFLLFRGGRKVSPRVFFKWTGILIVMIAAGLLVQAVGIMQDMNMMGSVIPHLYDLTWFMPEHPIDYAHYVRDTGHTPLISGEVGIFLKALFGYSSMPSLEEVMVYVGYFVALYVLIMRRNAAEAVVPAESRRKHDSKPAINPELKSVNRL
jgi:high-affinity iron transporter